MDLSSLIKRAWDDPEFKRQLLAEPKRTIERELGITLPAEIRIFIHEQTPTTLHLILPIKPDDAENDNA
jgi:hypothetical protein